MIILKLTLQKIIDVAYDVDHKLVKYPSSVIDENTGRDSKKFYKVMAVPALLYGCATWVTVKRHLSRVEASDMRFL